MINEAKLKGRMVECGYTLTSFADAMKLSRPSMRKKLNGSVEFKASEIERARSLLRIEKSDISVYFFAE